MTVFPTVSSDQDTKGKVLQVWPLCYDSELHLREDIEFKFGPRLTASSRVDTAFESEYRQAINEREKGRPWLHRNLLRCTEMTKVLTVDSIIQ